MSWKFIVHVVPVSSNTTSEEEKPRSYNWEYLHRFKNELKNKKPASIQYYASCREAVYNAYTKVANFLHEMNLQNNMWVEIIAQGYSWDQEEAQIFVEKLKQYIGLKDKDVSYKIINRTVVFYFNVSAPIITLTFLLLKEYYYAILNSNRMSDVVFSMLNVDSSPRFQGAKRTQQVMAAFYLHLLHGNNLSNTFHPYECGVNGTGTFMKRNWVLFLSKWQYFSSLYEDEIREVLGDMENDYYYGEEFFRDLLLQTMDKEKVEENVWEDLDLVEAEI